MLKRSGFHARRCTCLCNQITILGAIETQTKQNPETATVVFLYSNNIGEKNNRSIWSDPNQIAQNPTKRNKKQTDKLEWKILTALLLKKKPNSHQCLVFSAHRIRWLNIVVLFIITGAVAGPFLLSFLLFCLVCDSLLFLIRFCP